MDIAVKWTMKCIMLISPSNCAGFIFFSARREKKQLTSVMSYQQPVAGEVILSKHNGKQDADNKRLKLVFKAILSF